jgi:hypothetical protein
MTTKYFTLLKILDTIREEADSKHIKKYIPSDSKDNYQEKINQARARAFIHLYLKVSFGLLDFNEREHYITDGSYDGGIDGYYINSENKTIYLIQSKFRTTEKNFEEKNIKLEEVLVMDVNRVLDGEELNEDGISYNGKIKQLQREVSNIDNIARYSYQIVILANLEGISDSKLKQLTGGYAAKVFNHEKCYDELVFPIISGTYFNATDLNINIDLSNKNAGSKISYTVQTKSSECEITVLFVPTFEVGRIMYKYKNSILKYNPRSYLQFEGKKVNNAIEDTILNKSTNEFALFNNGITMLSDETFINEKIGQKNKAQLIVKNPQIINGGQTSYTLSRIYKENIENIESVFKNKEVLLKIITLLDKNDQDSKIQLIEDISTATNQQTPVNSADRFSNSKLHQTIQKFLYDRYGILYERKRGEFSDGVFEGYISKEQVIERNLFFRIYYAANGKINKSRQKKLFIVQDFDEETINDIESMDRFFFGYLCFKKMHKHYYHLNQRIEPSVYAKLRAMTLLYKPNNLLNFQENIQENLSLFNKRWSKFISLTSKKEKYIKHTKTLRTGKEITLNSFDVDTWYNSTTFDEDVLTDFPTNEIYDDLMEDESTNINLGDEILLKDIDKLIPVKGYSTVEEVLDTYFANINMNIKIEDLIDRIIATYSINLKDLSHLLRKYRLKGNVQNIVEYGCHILPDNIGVRYNFFLNKNQSTSEKVISDPNEIFSVGHTISFTIIGIDPKNHRINISCLKEFNKG